MPQENGNDDGANGNLTTTSAGSTGDEIPLPVSETPAVVEPPVPWRAPTLQELDPGLYASTLGALDSKATQLLPTKPVAPAPPVGVDSVLAGAAALDAADETTLPKTYTRGLDLARHAKQLDDLLAKINDAEKARRKWKYTHVVGTFGIWEVAYVQMGLQEKVWRQELLNLLVRIAEAELDAGVTLDDIMNQSSMSSDDRSFITRWLDQPAHDGSLDAIGKPIGRAARGLLQGLWALVTDMPGVLDGLNQTAMDLNEDPQELIKRLSDAIDQRARALGNGDIEFGYNQILLEVVSGELLSLGAGKLTKAAALRLISKARLRIALIKAAREVAEHARLSPDEAARAAAYPGKRIVAAQNEIGELRNLLKRYGFDLEIVDNIRSGVNQRRRIVRLNGKELTIGLLVDEFLHVWNRGRKGQFLPEDLAKLHKRMVEYTYAVNWGHRIIITSGGPELSFNK